MQDKINEQTVSNPLNKQNSLSLQPLLPPKGQMNPQRKQNQNQIPKQRYHQREQITYDQWGLIVDELLLRDLIELPNELIAEKLYFKNTHARE